MSSEGKQSHKGMTRIQRNPTSTTIHDQITNKNLTKQPRDCARSKRNAKGKMVAAGSRKTVSLTVSMQFCKCIVGQRNR